MDATPRACLPHVSISKKSNIKRIVLESSEQTKYDLKSLHTSTTLMSQVRFSHQFLIVVCMATVYDVTDIVTSWAPVLVTSGKFLLDLLAQMCNCEASKWIKSSYNPL